MDGLRPNSVLITGVLGGIGRETAKYYRRNKWRVIGLDIAERDYDRVCDHYFRIDLSSDNLCAQLAGISLSHPTLFGRISHFVPLAAMQVCGQPEEVDMSQWDLLFRVNVRSIYEIARFIFPSLKQHRGSIVVVGSIHAYQSSKSISMYAISKAALTGLVRNLAIDWAQYGIRVNGVAPGAVETPMLMAGLARSTNPDDLETTIAYNRLRMRHLTDSISQPEDIASIIYFLGDHNQSRAINGQTIIADNSASLVLSTEVDH